MKIAILGAGKQARGALQFLVNNSSKIEAITLADKNCIVAQALAREYNEANEEADPDLYNEFKISVAALDASSSEEISVFLKDYDVAFNALPYTLALNATKAAIAARCNMVDLGGNSSIVSQQLSLHDEANAAGITIIPDCGLAPGLVSLLVKDSIENSRISQMDSIKIYVGGIPREKDKAGPLQYGDFFSLDGLVNEYTQPVKVLRDGEIEYIDPLTELEQVSISSPHVWFTDLEAFSTSGGISTLPETYKGIIKNIQYKTLRFPGHLKALELLKATNSLNKETFQKLLPKNLKDQVFVKVVADGFCSEGHKIRRQYVLHDYTLMTSSELTSMMRCTAYPALAVMLQLNDLPSGVFRQEEIVDVKKVFQVLRKNYIKIFVEDHIIYNPEPHREHRSIF